jgi:hypothetical protein
VAPTAERRGQQRLGQQEQEMHRDEVCDHHNALQLCALLRPWSNVGTSHNVFGRPRLQAWWLVLLRQEEFVCFFDHGQRSQNGHDPLHCNSNRPWVLHCPHRLDCPQLVR